MILGTTNPGDVVLDPFFGTGTTGAVAKMLGRDYIGIEREEASREVAGLPPVARPPAETADAIATTRAKRAGVRPSARRVIERGMLRPGEELFSIGNRHKAKVRADGSLIGNDVKGSIHQVGAALEGAPSCNGWTYWHFRREGKMIPLDILRQQIARRDAGGAPAQRGFTLRPFPPRHARGRNHLAPPCPHGGEFSSVSRSSTA